MHLIEMCQSVGCPWSESSSVVGHQTHVLDNTAAHSPYLIVSL